MRIASAWSLIIGGSVSAQRNLGGLVPDPELRIALLENGRHAVERGERLRHAEIPLRCAAAVPIGAAVDGVTRQQHRAGLGEPDQKALMTGRVARKERLGGEILCEVW